MSTYSERVEALRAAALVQDAGDARTAAVPQVRPARPPTPALDAWHARLRAGYGGQSRSCRSWLLDALWRSACVEQSALEAVTPESTERLLAQARTILIDAAKAAP